MVSIFQIFMRNCLQIKLFLFLWFRGRISWRYDIIFTNYHWYNLHKKQWSSVSHWNKYCKKQYVFQSNHGDHCYRIEIHSYRFIALTFFNWIKRWDHWFLLWRGFFHGTQCHPCDNKLPCRCLWLSESRWTRVLGEYGVERSTTRSRVDLQKYRVFWRR